MKRQILELLSKQNGIIPTAKLNAILTEFVSSYNRPDRACLSEQWLKEEAILRVLQEQIASNSTFVEACKKLDLWSDELATKYNSHNQKAADVFINSLTKENLLGEKHKPKTQIAESFEVHFIIMDSGLTADFAETFDDRCAQSIEGHLLDLEKMASDPQQKLQFEEIMRSLYRDLHSIKGTARFISAALTEKLIHASEDLLGFAQQFHSQLSRDDLKNVFNQILKSIDIALALRKPIVEKQSEEPFWQDAASKNNYLSHLRNLQILKKELDQRGLQIKISDIASEF